MDPELLEMCDLLRVPFYLSGRHSGVHKTQVIHVRGYRSQSRTVKGKAKASVSTTTEHLRDMHRFVSKKAFPYLLSET